MKKLGEQSWKALALLSIVVPVSLLASFRLTGILSEPRPSTIAETTVLQPAIWESEKPTFSILIEDLVERKFDSDISIKQSVFISKFFQRFGTPYGNSNVLTIGVNLTATVAIGFVESVNMTFREDYTLSEADILNPRSEEDKHVLANLSFRDWADGKDGAWKLGGDLKAFIDLKAVNRPSEVEYWTVVWWILRSPVSQAHKVRIDYETTYFNGSVYKQVVQPFELRITPDNNNGFETADNTTSGTQMAYIGYIDDKFDYYAFLVEYGQVISANLTYSPNSQMGSTVGANLYLYDSNRSLRAESLYISGDYREITFLADFAGLWYLEVEAFDGYFFQYFIKVSVTTVQGV